MVVLHQLHRRGAGRALVRSQPCRQTIILRRSGGLLAAQPAGTLLWGAGRGRLETKHRFAIWLRLLAACGRLRRADRRLGLRGFVGIDWKVEECPCPASLDGSLVKHLGCLNLARVEAQ
eukprot:scaffold675899_cov79-Prasinocladus_malaysianus.AAC.1